MKLFRKKPHLYILHGWSTGLHEGWPKFLEKLGKRGIDATLLKIPGLTSPMNESWVLDNYVDWLFDKVRGNEPIILVGHSFGGQIAVRFAARYPELIDKLVLIDPAGVRDYQFAQEVKRKVFRIIAKFGKPFRRISILRRLLYKFAGEQDYLKASPTLRKTMRAVLAEEVVEDLKRIKIRTLIIWGKNDTITPLRLSNIFSQHIPNNTLVVIEKARHGPQFSHPDKVADIINEFLS